MAAEKTSNVTTAIEVKQAPIDVHVLPEDALRPGQSDEAVLARFGKRQQLQRSFHRLPTWGLVCGLLLTWESLSMSLSFGLQNGGPSGLVYGFLFAWGGAFLQALVMAEMASMIPLAGGPFNWVAVLSPPSCRKFLSYLTGWLTMLSWQVLVSSCGYLSASGLQGLLVLTNASYVPERWQCTLLIYAFLAMALFANTVLVKILPAMQVGMLAIQILGFLGVLIPLVVMSRHQPASTVFSRWENYGAWPSQGVAFLVGLATPCGGFLGIDGADHIAEEIRDPQRIIPVSMLAMVGMNGAMGFAMLLALLFALTDVDAALKSATGFPFMQIYLDGTGSTTAALGLSAVVVVAQMYSLISIIAATSRMTWAFARERGVPFSAWVSRVHAGLQVPLNAIVVTVAINMALALINIGSTAAFQAFTALIITAYYGSFLIAAAVMLHRRLSARPDEIAWGPFRLGRLGVPLTLVAMAYTLLVFFWLFWPTAHAGSGLDATNMNYASAIFGGVMLFSVGFYAAYGRGRYTGPVIEL